MALHRRVVVSAFSPFTAIAALALFFLASVVTEAAANAQATSASSTELTTLERDLAREADALSTSDCVVACRALASIRRAADRICALDPDARCTAARAKADEATERVRRACPQCAIEHAPTPTPAPMTKPAPPSEKSEHLSKGGGDSTVTAASAPPSESKRGGCAGCALAASSPIEPRAAGLGLAAVVLLVLRRSRRSRRDLPSEP